MPIKRVEGEGPFRRNPGEVRLWYYLKSSGAMQTGWWHNSGHYYYFGSNGLMTSDSTSPSYLEGENNRLSDMRSRGWYVSPERHSNPAYEYESRNMWNLPIQRVSYSDRQRGDLIYYDNGYGTIIHVAIYLGDDRVIETWPPSVTVMSTVNSIHPHVYGVQRLFA